MARSERLGYLRSRKVARTIPHRERYLLLNDRVARWIVQAHADRLDEVESQLEKRRRPRPRRGGSAKP